MTNIIIRPIVAAIAALAMAAPALAQTLDADADGNVTLEEFQAAYPDETADTFASLDGDGDGVLSAAEVQAAIDAGTLPG
ncbi:EF-hand domain-containing protein [Jannaschia sp. LMIT008]|uniref:EF-hand domain-containing protein n=1 Tax=Jannaschia maritima TaxID=3032585 RepID=UPI002810F156|nr:EF-hand domain-containing protein [Jannaschia sp. LMIT008]